MKSNCYIFCYLLLILVLNSCAGLLEKRSFVTTMDRQNDYRLFEPEKDFDVVVGDKGRIRRTEKEILARRPASKREKKIIYQENALAFELQKLESTLVGRQFDEYNKIKDYLPSRGQKMFYLKLLPSERKEYLRSLGVKETYGQFYRKTLKAPSRYELSGLYNLPQLDEGMNKEEVEGVWGNPIRVEIAGNPANQNEKWTFYQNGKSNIVYFENGEVHGWELH